MIDAPTQPAPACAAVEPLLAAGIFGSLDADKRRELEAHLAGCASCRALADDLKQGHVADALLDEGVVDPGDFRELRVVLPENYIRGEEIGRGGMGRIVRARDRRLGRSVVIKELLDGRMRERFELEARLTARLQHPAIVNVHEAGRWPNGESFYAMKHVAGQPLDRAIASRRTLAERLELLPNLITVVEAVAYAHSQRVIHRDLKPANILVGPFGETVVIDWGLAKDLSRDSGDERKGGPYRGDGFGLTVAGAGTPDYMPPEQAVTGPAPPDERVDVFALGATLHHLLAGAPPRRELLPLETPRELAAIARKAMARDPRDRYPGAGELAEELRRFQSGRLVAAHSYTLRERLARFVRRHRAFVAAALFSLAALAVVGGVSLRQVLMARRRAEAQLAELLLERGREELARGAPSRALVYLAEAQARGLDGPALRALLGDAARPADELEARVALPVRPQAAAFAPDGAHLVTADAAGEILLWDLARREGMPVARAAGTPVVLAYAPDGSAFLAAGGDEVRVHGAGGELIAQLPLSARVSTARWVGAGTIESVAGGHKTEWDLSTRERFTSTTPSDAPAGDLAEQGARMKMTVAAGSSTAELSAPGGTPMALRHGAPILGAHLAGDDSVAVTAGRDGTIRLWDGKTGMERAVFDAGATILDARLDDGGRRLRALTEEGQLLVWRPRGRLVALRGGAAARYERASFGPRGEVALVDSDGALEVLGRDGEVLATEKGVALAALGDRLVTAGPGGIDRIELGGARAHAATPVSPVAISADRVLELGGRLLDGSGKTVATLPGHHLTMVGSVIAGLRAWDRAAVWDAATGAQLFELAVEHSPTIAGQDVLVSASGELLATMLSARRVGLWEVATGRKRAELLAPGAVEQVALSDDGRRVLTAGSAAGVQLWDRDGKLLLELPVASASAVAFDAPAARVIAGELDGWTRVFDAETGLLLQSFGPLPEPVSDVAFAPDGSRAVALAGGHAAVWDTRLSTRAPADVARLVAGLPLRLEGGRLAVLSRPGGEDEGAPALRARQAFERGSLLLDRRQYARALESFAAAFRASPDPEYSLAMATAMNGLGDVAANRNRMITDRMKERFERGQEAYGQRRYEEAIDLFREAYAIKPAASLLFNVAVCYEKLRRYDEAAATFERYLSLSPNPRDRAAVVARIAALQALAARPSVVP